MPLASSVPILISVESKHCEFLGPSERLLKQSMVMTVEADTTLWLCGGLCLEVCHMVVKIA